ncbi:hypothetical protein BDF14DRAFT_1794301 [Spinellus fusiger]|nr:hypothetical protein BDF14DRAFT_1794301 [Spinellus fusiger]
MILKKYQIYLPYHELYSGKRKLENSFKLYTVAIESTNISLLVIYRHVVDPSEQYQYHWIIFISVLTLMTNPNININNANLKRT